MAPGRGWSSLFFVAKNKVLLRSSSSVRDAASIEVIQLAIVAGGLAVAGLAWYYVMADDAADPVYDPRFQY